MQSFHEEEIQGMSLHTVFMDYQNYTISWIGFQRPSSPAPSHTPIMIFITRLGHLWHTKRSYVHSQLPVRILLSLSKVAKALRHCSISSTDNVVLIFSPPRVPPCSQDWLEPVGLVCTSYLLLRATGIESSKWVICSKDVNLTQTGKCCP